MLELSQIRLMTDRFCEEDGRRPRLLLAALGDTADERMLRLYAAAFADAGFDIDVSPLKQCPADTARMAAENDVHAVGLCGLLPAEDTLITQLQTALATLEREDIPCFARLPEGADWDVTSLLASFPEQNKDYHVESFAVIQRLNHILFHDISSETCSCCR